MMISHLRVIIILTGIKPSSGRPWRALDHVHEGFLLIPERWLRVGLLRTDSLSTTPSSD